jgi:hypothetical protein
MERPAKAKKPQLFQREQTILRDAKANLASESLDSDILKAQMADIISHYEDLLDQSKLITKVSDRLQKKIIKATTAVEEKNGELQKTIDALTKAKVGRKAATMTLGIAIALFLLGEGLLEPQIDKWITGSSLAKYQFENVNFIGLALKAAIAILIRPIEKLVEKRMMAKAMKEKELEQASIPTK